MWRWAAALVAAVALLYGSGLCALLATRASYVERCQLFLSVDDRLVWQGRTGPGYRVWTAGPAQLELWRAYRWVPWVRSAQEVWERGAAAARSVQGRVGSDP